MGPAEEEKMMSIGKEDVEYIANLARLNLSEEEKQNYSKQLDDVVRYMEKLNELDVSLVPPTSHVLALGSTCRPDEPRACMSRFSPP